MMAMMARLEKIDCKVVIVIVEGNKKNSNKRINPAK